MAAKDPKKKYVVLENILNSINSRVIALEDKEIKMNNIILTVVIDTIIDKMKQKDPLFGGLYREKYYGGSYYDNLKVGKPNEFDLDLILNLPVIIDPRVKSNSLPGFVKVEIKEYLKIMERPEAERARFEKINILLDNNKFLSTNKVLQWMEGVIKKALNEMSSDEKGTYVDAVFDRTKPHDVIRIYAKMVKGGPAFTFILSGKNSDGSDIQLDVDLVPCFQFNNKTHWPDESGGYRPNPSTTKDRFLVVPKKPREKNLANLSDIGHYWRLSFQEQERELITGDTKKVLKPSLRLLKMLKKYEEQIRSNSIPYYWNKQYNLIGYLNDTTKSDIANTLRNIISEVDRRLDDVDSDPFVIGKYLLSKEEFEKLKTEVKLSKKQEKQLQFSATSTLLNNPSIDTFDSAGSSKSPLVRLGFEPQLAQLHKEYSDTLEQQQKRFLDDIMTQINATTHIGSAHHIQLANHLKRIDEKLDVMLKQFDLVLEENRNTNGRVISLEEKVRQLEIENRNLRSRLSPGYSGDINSIDALLSIRQTDNPANIHQNLPN